MKEVKKSVEFEPTLSDVLEAVQTGFAKVEARLDHHEDLLSQHGKQLLQQSSVLKTLVAGQDNLLERVNVLDQRVSKTQHRVEDVVDEHGTTLLDYGRRITTLEKARA